jgi:hypothetical protein
MAAWEAAAQGSSQSRVTGYDPTKFYVSSTDNRGHRSRTALSLPPDILREIHNLIELRAFPAYRQTQDFIRDAVHHHLHTRGQQLADPRVRVSFPRSGGQGWLVADHAA